MRKSDAFLLFSLVCASLLVLSIVDAASGRQQAAERLQQSSRQVAALGLTDLALFTEARYTRHLTQSDLHTAFQDHPMAMEHYPSGSLLLPPRWYQRQGP